MAFSRFVQFQVNVDSGIPTSDEISVTHNGATFVFDRPVPVGYFVTGEPFVVSSSAFQIVDDLPASVAADGGVKNGIMKDPYVAEGQGFDEFIGTANQNPWMSANSPYDPTLNLAPSLSGVGIPIGAGEQASFVKALRRGDLTSPNAWQVLAGYAKLHVLAVRPPAGAYPPSASALTKRIWTRGDVRLQALRSLSFPASWSGTSFQSTSTSIPDDLGLYGKTGQDLRRFRLDNALGSTATNYSRDIADNYARFIMLLHDDTLSAVERDAIVDTVVRFAIQIHGLVERGWGNFANVNPGGVSGGAGQQGAVHPWIYYGAFLLGDPPMLAAAQGMATNMNANGYWPTPEVIGTSAPGKSGVNAQTFFEEHLGTPFIIPDEWGSNFDTRYGVIAGNISVWETLAVALLRDGPGGVTGTQAMLKGGAFDDSNPAAAHVAMMDRVRQWVPWAMSSDDPGAMWRDLYDLVRPLMEPPRWMGRPDQLPIETASSLSVDNWLAAGPSDGAIQWDISPFDYSSGLILRRDFRYSLDGVQWVEELDVPAQGSKSGLLRGASHYCGMRLVSTDGAGLWSANYPRGVGGNERGRVATSGIAPSAQPAFVVAPQIHARIHPAWNQDLGNWKPVSGILQANEVQLSCGAGYCSGHPAPTYTYQWNRDGIPIAGATNKQYDRKKLDAGAMLTCEISATNGVGAPTVMTTAGVVCPEVTPLPSNILIDTDFGWEFAIDYEDEFAARSTSGADLVHNPTEALGGDAEGMNTGALFLDKTSSWPSGSLPFKNPAIPGRTYEVTAQVVFRGGASGDGTFRIRNGSGQSVLDGGDVICPRDQQTPYNVFDISDTITVAQGESDLLFTVAMSIATATGGSGGGDGWLSRLRVREI